MLWLLPLYANRASVVSSANVRWRKVLQTLSHKLHLPGVSICFVHLSCSVWRDGNWNQTDTVHAKDKCKFLIMQLRIHYEIYYIIFHYKKKLLPSIFKYNQLGCLKSFQLKLSLLNGLKKNKSWKVLNLFWWVKSMEKYVIIT